jgi:exonuclease III
MWRWNSPPLFPLIRLVFLVYFFMFPSLTFSALNCNSLNVSTISSMHQRLKIYGICKLKTDIILLSDIRLQSNKNFHKEIETQFLINPICSYEFFHNSLSNSRGVGILIKKSSNVIVNPGPWCDKKGNSLLLLFFLDSKPVYIQHTS